MKLATPRLELVPATVALVHADLKGRPQLARLLAARVPETWPPPRTEFATMLWTKQQMKAAPHHVGWLGWYWILTESRVLIGLGGFKGYPNSNGVVEIGYSVVETFQRKGYATEAVGTLCDWAFRDALVRRVVAETFPRLSGSIRVLEKNRFRQVEAVPVNGVIRFELTREDQIPNS
jgi:ribosomal-protein-alanine N-acetyltransferase